MGFNINQKIWLYVERLYIHCYGIDSFVIFLKQFGIDYKSDVYDKMKKRIHCNGRDPVYVFMSEENYDFGHFMQTVPSYKYLSILEKVVFDEEIVATKNDGWNYYGEGIKKWYPAIIDLLRVEEIIIYDESQKLTYQEEEEATEAFSGFDFLPYGFQDMFLDYIRKEINECYKGGQFLAVMILSRKLLESLFIRILQSVFPKIANGQYSEKNHFIWYNQFFNGYHSFNKLIENMKNNSFEFKEDKDLIESMCSKVKPFKNETNLFVHQDYKIPDESYVKSWKVASIVALVGKAYKKYCNP